MKKAQVIASTVLQREKIVYGLIGLALLFFGFYGILMNQTILNAVNQQKALGAINQIERDLAELELAFIETENDINLDYAFAHGFQSVAERHFVTRDTNLSLR